MAIKSSIYSSRQSLAFPSLLFPHYWFFFFPVLAVGVHKDIDRVSTWNGPSQDFTSRRLVGFQFINRVKQSFYSQWLMMYILTTDKSSSISITPLIFVIYLQSKHLDSSWSWNGDFLWLICNFIYSKKVITLTVLGTYSSSFFH